MNDARSANVKAELRPAFAGRGAGSLLEIGAWMLSEISAISPLVERRSSVLPNFSVELVHQAFARIYRASFG